MPDKEIIAGQPLGRSQESFENSPKEGKEETFAKDVRVPTLTFPS